MKSSELIPLLDDKFIEQQFRAELKAQGLSRSAIPKRLYRQHLEAFKVGWRKSVIEQLQKQPNEPLRDDPFLRRY